MKKKLSFIVLFISVCLNLSAYTVYLAPMAASGGIPMNPIRTPNNSHYTRVEGYVNSDGADLIFNPYDSVENSALKVGRYTDQEMIALGGIKEMTSWEGCKDSEVYASLEISATCPNGFYFVSQSNPAYKRPFELYLIPKILVYGKFVEGYPKSDRYGTPRVLSNDNYKVAFSYYDLIRSKDIWQDNDDHAHQLWFDMVLVLPGEIENDVLTLDGKKYPLTESDDYSAVVTISMKARIPKWTFFPAHWVGGLGGYLEPARWEMKWDEQIKTITIPFSGFYKSEQVSNDKESVSMYVHPVASAGNINMQNYARQQIADLEVMTVKVHDAAKVNACAIFLSSNENPYEAGTQFKLVKENISYDEPLTDYNSVSYKAYLVNNKDKTQEIEYDGTTSVDKTLSDINCNQNDKLVIPKKFEEKNTHSYGVDYWYYSGSVYIAIQDNSAIIMEAGRYTSTVYVHVMGL